MKSINTKPAKKFARRSRVLQLLKSNKQGYDAASLSKQLGVTKRTITADLTYLIQTEKVKKIGRGRSTFYQLVK